MDTGVDWGAVEFRPGGWSCPVHGPITPRRGVVPYCAEDVAGDPCQRIALRYDGPGRHVEPRPATCSRGHPYQPGKMQTGWRSCRCTPAGGHRTWTCATCGDEQQHPEHDPTVPYAR